MFLNLTLNSGEAPIIKLYSDNSASIVSNEATLTDGLNEIDLVSTTTDDVIILISNTTDTNFATSTIFILRTYSEDYIKIKFTNGKDLPSPVNEPTILYQDSFFDEVWFKRTLKLPEHETTRIGTEKDGIFISEKIVSVYKYKLIDWIGPNLYRALHRLPLHDDVTITDTVGNDYDVGHDTLVDIVDWTYYDIGKLTIRFNDGASVFEGNAANIT